MAGKVHVWDEVVKHNNKTDCWLIISGKVYDVTPYLVEHPGGDDIMITATGKDATDDFEDVGHSSDAREKMKEYCIGEIEESTIPVKQRIVPPPSAVRHEETGGSFKVLLYVLPLLILVVAFLFGYNSKTE